MLEGARDSGSQRGGGIIDGKSGSNWRGGVRETKPERDEYGGGSGGSGGSRVMNVGGARLTAAERGGPARDVCRGNHRGMSRQRGGGGNESYLPTRGRSETERDCGASAYQRTYCGDTKMENENA